MKGKIIKNLTYKAWTAKMFIKITKMYKANKNLISQKLFKNKKSDQLISSPLSKSTLATSKNALSFKGIEIILNIIKKKYFTEHIKKIAKIWERFKNQNIYNHTTTSGFWKPRSYFYQDKGISNSIDLFMKSLVNNIERELQYREQNFSEAIANAIVKSLKYNPKFGFTHDNYYPIIQHILNNVFSKILFNKKILINITKNLVDYSQFDIIFQGPQPIIEAFILMRNLEGFITQNQKELRVIAQNHARSEELLDFKDACYAQLGQAFADFRIEINLNKMLFMDVKGKTDPIKNVGAFKGAIGLTINSNYKEEYLKKFISDLRYTIANKIKDTPNLSPLIKDTQKAGYMRLHDICKKHYENSNIHVNEKYQRITQEIHKVMLDPELTIISFSFFANCTNSTELEDINIETLQAKMKPLNDSEHFPPNGEITNEPWSITFNEYLDKAIENAASENRILLLEFQKTFDNL